MKKMKYFVTMLSIALCTTAIAITGCDTKNQFSAFDYSTRAEKEIHEITQQVLENSNTIKSQNAILMKKLDKLNLEIENIKRQHQPL